MNEDADQRTNEILRALLEDDDDDLVKEVAGPGDPPPALLSQAIRSKERYLGYKFKGKPIVHTNPLGETFVFGKFGSVMSTLLYYDTATAEWRFADGQGLGEGLEDEDDFKDLVEPKKYLPLGTILRATGIEQDVLEAELKALATVDPEKAAQYQGDDNDPAYLAYEVLPNVLQKYCLPYTYFGNFESDGDWGVWASREAIQEALEDPDTMVAVAQGQPIPKGSKYVVVLNRDDYPVALLDGAVGAEIWHVNY